MLRNFVAVIFLVVSAQANSVGWGNLWRPQFGDARCARQYDGLAWATNDFNVFSFEPPAGNWHDLTLTCWLRFVGNAESYYSDKMLTYISYCPEETVRIGDDLTAGRFGYTDGTNLSGMVSMDYAFCAEANVPSTVFPRGAYTIAGWSSNAVSLSLGGNEIALGPGAFNRNALPGGSDTISLSGSGMVSVGISKMHAHQFFGGSSSSSDSIDVLDTDIVSNTLIFAALRLHLDAAAHYYCRDLWPSQSERNKFCETNALPNNPACRAFSASGIYRFGLGGVASDAAFSWDLFDARLQTKWLSDEDLARIYRNGAEEIGRREIPKFK